VNKIAIIGNGIQSKRIQKILKSKKLIFTIFNPTNKLSPGKEYHKRLLTYKYIFICSPDNTHFYYIKALYSKAYIFCEKPPVITKKDLRSLKKLNCDKIFFNFNLRFSKLSEVLSNIKIYNLGQLIHGNISISHGLATQEKYLDNWRSNKKQCPKGVYEVVSIHIIDLINYHFRLKSIENPLLMNLSKKGTSYDTSLVNLKVENNKATISIFSTYYGPKYNNWSLLFTNGIIERNNNKITIYGPAKNFDRMNFFIPPKVKESFTISEINDYNSSLENSVNYFLEVAKFKRKFYKKEINCSLESCHLMLKG